METIRIGIMGYGNLGRGVELAANASPDIELEGIFTRRDPTTVKPCCDNLSVFSADELIKHKDAIDVLVICGGSATDLPYMTPQYVKHFNVVDSFDTHARIPEHFDNVDTAALASNHVGIISTGWDPGLFSLARLYSTCVLPDGCDYTFWGRGVSQGHSDAIRRIDGVVDARQYTVPVQSSLDAVRSGQNPKLTTRQKHTRECFVVAEQGADLAAIEHEIKTMPNYFADYDTTVTFISEEELQANHSGIPHGGSVIRTGKTGQGNQHLVEFSLKLDSNPEFTGSVLVACARAAARMQQAGQYGCKTLFDIPPALLSPLSAQELRAHML